jgi:hypothetical protein
MLAALTDAATALPRAMITDAVQRAGAAWARPSIRPLAAIAAIFTTIPHILARVADIFPLIAHVLARVAPVFHSVADAAVVLSIPHIFLRVPHVLSAIADIFAKIPAILTPVAHIFFPIVQILEPVLGTGVVAQERLALLRRRVLPPLMGMANPLAGLGMLRQPLLGLRILGEQVRRPRMLRRLGPSGQGLGRLRVLGQPLRHLRMLLQELSQIRMLRQVRRGAGMIRRPLRKPRMRLQIAWRHRVLDRRRRLSAQLTLHRLLERLLICRLLGGGRTGRSHGQQHEHPYPRSPLRVAVSHLTPPCSRLVAPAWLDASSHAWLT